MSKMEHGDNLIKYKREQFRVQLRKEHTENLFKNKRQLLGNSQPANYELMEQKIVEWYSNLVDNKIGSTLNQLGEYLSQQDEQLVMKLKMLDKHEVYPLLLEIWRKCELDPIIIKDLLKSLCNLHSYTIFDDMKFLKDRECMEKVFALLHISNDVEIQQQIFFLLGNLIGMDNGAKARVLADYKFCEQIKNLWLNKLIIIEVYNLKDFTWFLSNFYSYKATNIAAFTKNEVESVCPIVLECLRINDRDVTVYSLNTLKSMIDQKEEIISFLLKQPDLYPYFCQMSICQDLEIVHCAIQVLMSYFLGGESTSSEVIELGILDHMDKLYITPQQSIKNKKVLIWGLANSCIIQEFETIKKIINHNVMKHVLIDGVTTSDSHHKREILELIKSLSQMNSLDLLKYAIMSKNIVDIVITTLMQKLSKDITLLCLSIIYNFAERIGRHSHGEINMAIEVFNAKGLLKLLNDMEFQQEDEDVAVYALKIHENFYI